MLFEQNNKRLIILIATLAIVFIMSLHFQVSAPINNFYQKISNLFDISKKNSEKIIIIKITDDDIYALGGFWPIRRTIYASLIEKLQESKAKWIGIEIYFPPSVSARKIYDEALIETASKYSNITFASVAIGSKNLTKMAKADSVKFPFLKEYISDLSTGHANYYYENGRYKIPSYIFWNNQTVKSFSLEIAEKVGVQFEFDNLIVNFSDYDFLSISLLDFYELAKNKEEIYGIFKDKIVLIGVDSKFLSQKIYSNNQEISALYLQAFALNNLLEKNYLKSDLYLPSSIILIFLLTFALFLAANKAKRFYSLAFLFMIFPIFLDLFVRKAFYYEINYSLFFWISLFSIIAKITQDSLSFYSKRKKALIQNKNEQIIRESKPIIESEDNNGKTEANVHVEAENALTLEETKKIISGAKFFEGIWYFDESMEKVIELIQIASQTDKPVLIVGESGVGKELIARAIHNLGPRKNKNFVAVNCAALSESLLESELFGHVKGAFTGAASDKTGRFELADGGTIFLDEIGETSENFQTKLLRVVQFGTFEKVGSSKEIKVDVRIIAATNKNLEKLVEEKKFREDLFYRLKVLMIEAPPLRKRRKDIPVLAYKFAERENLKISDLALQALYNLDWKGNVRELEAAINRAAIFAKSKNRNEILIVDFDSKIFGKTGIDLSQAILDSLRRKKFAKAAIMQTAVELGDLSRNTVTEYFKGECFKAFVESNYDLDKASFIIAGSDNLDVVDKVKDKLAIFLDNIKKDLPSELNDEKLNRYVETKSKNLPQKYKVYLQSIAKHYANNA